MRLHGNAQRFGDHVDTDQIIPGRYLTNPDPVALAAHALEGAQPPGFALRVLPGDLIVAGVNFGCGSSREHAPVALRASGASGVVAASFARIFFRNAINIGFPVVECPEAVAGIEQGDEVTVDLATGQVANLTTGKKFATTPYEPFVMDLLQAGGLVPYTRAQLKESRT